MLVIALSISTARLHFILSHCQSRSLHLAAFSTRCIFFDSYSFRAVRTFFIPFMHPWTRCDMAHLAKILRVYQIFEILLISSTAALLCSRLLSLKGFRAHLHAWSSLFIIACVSNGTRNSKIDRMRKMATVLDEWF